MNYLQAAWIILKNKFQWAKLTEKTYFGTFLLFYIPFFVFITLDLWLTYLGVCKLGGYEINQFAVNVATKFGFLAAGLTVYLIYAFLALLSTHFYRKTPHQIYKILMVIVWAYAVMNYASIIMSNSNAAFFLATGEELLPPQVQAQVQQQAIPESPEVLQKAAESFVERRNSFCRLLP